MELDQLKTIWQDVRISNSATTQEDLEQLLSKKSKSPIAKIKRNLFWELMFVIIMYIPTILYYFLSNKPGMFYQAILMLVLGGLYVWYYISKRRLLLRMECVTCEVKSNLGTQLKILEKYITLYMWAGTLLVPVLLILSFFIGLYLGPDNSAFLAQMGNKIIFVFLVWAVFSGILTIPLFYINKWYVHKLYGQHVKKLRNLLNEMNELPFGIN